ncbi:trypsin-like serine peptidase [Thauera sp. SDU_THAU2]|uniref:trypsin-like serine peptidase n=1 Tax=Thauera sp. SDU_THAU2 TaxID=3136633 RepID=UPI003120235C
MKIYNWVCATTIFGVTITADAQPLPASVGTVIQHTIDTISIDDPSGISWKTQLSRFGAKALLLTLEDIELPSGAEVVIRWDGGKIRMVDASRHAIPMIGVSQAELEIRGVPPGYPIRLKYELAAVLPRGRPFSFRDPPRFEEVTSIETGAIHKASHSVAAVFWQEDGRWQVCTGFMVSTRHLLTNHHCIGRPDQCERTLVIFGYRMINGVIDPGTSYTCKAVVSMDKLKELDLSVIELVVPAAVPPPPPLELATGTPRLGQPLVVLQHPQGSPMKVVRLGCDVRLWPVDSPTAYRKVGPCAPVRYGRR